MAYRLRLDHTRMTKNANRTLTDAQLRLTACEEQAHLKTIRFFGAVFQYHSVTSADMGLPPYDTAPDGQRFLLRATQAQAGQPLAVIVNWPALLKKGTAAE